jgi:putative thiamine transport system substrate-binding protein
MIARAAGAPLALAAPAFAQDAAWNDVLAKARGQTVHFNAWAGDEKTNAFIAWVGEETEKRYGVKVVHVKLKDTAEAVQRVVAEKAAARDSGGSVDLIWINGPELPRDEGAEAALRPYAERLPNWRYVDTVRKRSNLVDFTIPNDGYESPWRMAQIVFVVDGRRVKTTPTSIAALGAWAKAHPGRFTHPGVRNFLGATFLKQALYELAPDPSVLQRPATDATFAATTAPMWAWYDALKPSLWRGGAQFPENGPRSAAHERRRDRHDDLVQPVRGRGLVQSGLLPDSVRTFTLANGTIGNTSFVAIPYNASAKEGALVVANFLLEPATQARAQDVRQMGNFTVLDLAKLSPEDRKRFDDLPRHPALPTDAELGTTLLEPHPSWMTRITAEWERRYTK